MLRLKAGDTALPITGTILSASAGNAPMDLTGCTVVVTVLDSATKAVLLQQRAVTLVDPAAGTWRLDWQAGETDTAGKYSLELEITFPDGHVAHAPTDGFLTLLIEEALA